MLLFLFLLKDIKGIHYLLYNLIYKIFKIHDVKYITEKGTRMEIEVERRHNCVA